MRVVPDGEPRDLGQHEGLRAGDQAEANERCHLLAQALFLIGPACGLVLALHRQGLSNCPEQVWGL